MFNENQDYHFNLSLTGDVPKNLLPEIFTKVFIPFRILGEKPHVYCVYITQETLN